MIRKRVGTTWRTRGCGYSYGSVGVRIEFRVKLWAGLGIELRHGSGRVRANTRVGAGVL